MAAVLIIAAIVFVIWGLAEHYQEQKRSGYSRELAQAQHGGGADQQLASRLAAENSECTQAEYLNDLRSIRAQWKQYLPLMSGTELAQMQSSLITENAPSHLKAWLIGLVKEELDLRVNEPMWRQAARLEARHGDTAKKVAASVLIGVAGAYMGGYIGGSGRQLKA